MTSAATFDAGPLSWVKGEIDLALERVVQGLQQFGANTADLTQIKFCRTHLHQVRGALTIVGLDGVTQFTDALEALLTDLEAGRQAADTPRIALIGRAVASIRRFLDDLLAGDPNQPLRLLDLYRQIAAARGQTAPPASELFFPDLSTRPNLPSLTIADDGVAQLKAARSRYQKGLLAFIKAPQTPIGALELKLAAQMAASADASPSLRGFWWVASGFFAALGAKAIAADAETKALCARIDQQLRQQIDGSRAIPEKLMRDALFQVAIARTNNADIVAIKNAYELAALIPSTDSKTVAQAAQLEPFLKRLKEISTASEEAWNKFCTGSNSALQTFCDAAAALDQGAERLGNTDFRRLIRAVASTAAWIKEDRSRHDEAVALEVATGVLLIGNGVDNFTRLGPDFVHQVDLMVARLHACIAGTPMSRSEFPVLDDMTRRAQEKLLISQVVKEIQSSLGQIEQTLDTFFREPEQKDSLASCQKPISQIIGALSMLGHADAVAQLRDSGKQIARFQAADYQPEQRDFELVARQLSGLGFFVEALRAGVSDYHAFIRSLEVKPSKVDAAAEQAAIENAAQEVAAPPVAEPGASAIAELAPLGPVSEAVSASAASTPIGITENEKTPVTPTPASAADSLSVSPPATPAPAPTATAAPAAEPEVDAELLEIFLEEANEVVANIGDQLDILRSKPSDVEALTTLRRAFHTLKGSSRMVGLMRFGDVAWVIEQVHNLWLRQEKPVDASLTLLIEKSQEVFSAWVGHLENKDLALPDASELLALGEKLKGGETVAAPGRSPAAPPPPQEETPPAEITSEPVPDFSFDIELASPEINDGFAEIAADGAPARVDLTASEIALDAPADEGAMELAAPVDDTPTEPVTLDFDIDIGSDPAIAHQDSPEPILEQTHDLVSPDDANPITLDSELDIPSIELASLVIDPEDLALAEEAAEDEAESLDLVSLIVPPEPSSTLSIETSALEIEERYGTDENSTREPALDISLNNEQPSLEINEDMPAIELTSLIVSVDNESLELAATVDDTPAEAVALDIDIESDPEIACQDRAELITAQAPDVLSPDDANLIAFEGELDVPSIELASLVIDPEDLALAAEAAAEEPVRPADGALSLDIALDDVPAEIHELDAAVTVGADEELDSIELISLIAPPELISTLSIENSAPGIEERCATDEGSAIEAAPESIALIEEEKGEAEAASTTETVALIDSPPLDTVTSESTAAAEPDAQLAIMESVDAETAESLAPELPDAGREMSSDAASVAASDALAEIAADAAELPATQTELAAESHFAFETDPRANALEEPLSRQTIVVAPTLFQIFLEEAHAHVATLQRTFGELEITPAAPTPHEMLRAAHTVGSISGTVGFTPALKLGHGIEAALLRREKSRSPGSLEALEMLRIAIAELEMMLAAIERNETLGDVSALLSQMADLYPCEAAETIEEAASTLAGMGQPDDLREAAPAIDEPLPDDQLDASLLPIFIEEAADLVSGINERLSMWSDNPYDTDTIHALTRLLHTLKGSARMAGAMRLGALTHRLESSIESAHRAGGAAPVLIAALQADFDDIAEMAEHLGEASIVTPASDEVDLGEVLPELTIAGDDSLPEQTVEPSLTLTDVQTALAYPIAELDEVALEIAASEMDDAAPEADVTTDLALTLPVDNTPFEEAPADTEALPEALPEALTELDFDLNDTASLAEMSPSLDLSALDFATPATNPTSESANDYDLKAPAVDLQNFSSNATFDPQETAEIIAPAVPESPAAIEIEIDLGALADLPPDADVPVALESSSADEAKDVETLPEDHLDPDLLPIFLEEAVEIVRTVYEQLDAWQAAPTDGAATHGLARSLHTLKGSARMAGAMSLGALTHTLESRAEEAAKSGRASVALIEEMKHAFDAIAHVVERRQHGDALTDIRIELAEASTPVVVTEAPAEAVATTVETGTPSSRPAGTPPAATTAAAVTAPAAPAAVAATVAAAQRKDSDAAKPMLRVRAELIDNLVNDAGELSIARARIEGEMRSLKQSLLDLTENVIRLRRQLREIEIQAESQMQSRTAVTTDGTTDFDPLELDRFTRFQEVTRMMAESVNDVATVQQNLLKNLDEANAGLVAQGRLNRELQQELMSVRMVPFSSITERLQRIVRQTAKELNKRADLEVQGAGIELDQNVINKMIGPLEHLLRNAISHGIEMPALRVEQGKDEMGDIRLSLRQEGNEVIITMRDDGAGLNFSRIREKAISKGLLSASDPYDERKLTEMIFNSGFSTAEQVSQIAGRGVGMDVVMTEVTNLGGRIDVTSESGKGSVFRVYLPLTLAVTNAVIVRVGSAYYAIPAAMVDQVQEIKEAPLTKLRADGGGEWQGNYYPFHFLPRLLGEPNAQPEARRMYWVMYLHSGLQRVVVQVDELQSTHEIVVKNIGPQLARVIGIAGATVMGDGRVILILNPVALAARAPLVARDAVSLDASGDVVAQDSAAVEQLVAEPEKIVHVPTVMVVDDSLTVRKVTSRLLAREGYQVLTAKDGQDALEQLVEANPDVILSDIEMPRMDGFEFARNLRADERLNKIPVIMISSRTAEKHRAHAAELGVNHFLGKPYQEEELLGLITAFIAERRAGKSN